MKELKLDPSYEVHLLARRESGQPRKTAESESEEYGSLSSNTMKKYVKFFLFLFAKPDEKGVNIYNLPVPRIDIDESWYTNFVVHCLNVNNCQ